MVDAIDEEYNRKLGFGDILVNGQVDALYMNMGLYANFSTANEGKVQVRFVSRLGSPPSYRRRPSDICIYTD